MLELATHLPADADSGGARVVLGLEYCGAGYCGWQSQPTGATVQDALERALSRFADAPVRVVCAGRTDTGVHASLQVVHLDTSLTRTAQSWVRGTNAHLPDDIRVCWAHALTGNLAQEFHSRFAARARTYRYLLLNDAVAPAIQHGRVGWFHAPLDAQTMHAAAQCLVGEHDFSAFRAAECQAKTPVKQLFSVEVTRRGKWVVFTITANAFLHHMVRNIVGSLVYVGAGRETGSWFADLLTQRNRRLAAPTFAPHGLYLSHIDYDPRFGLLPYISDMTARQRLPDTP